MYVSSDFRQLGLGQKLLDIAIGFAKNIGYSRMVLDSSKMLYAARGLYLKNGLLIFLDTMITTELMCLWKKSYCHPDMINWYLMIGKQAQFKSQIKQSFL